MTCMDQPSDAEWCTVTNRALSRSSNRHSSAFISGISRALIEPASTSWTSLAMTWSLEVPVTGGRSLTSSGTRHGGHTCWYGGPGAPAPPAGGLVGRVAFPAPQGPGQLMAGAHVIEQPLRHREIYRPAAPDPADRHEPGPER